MKQFAGVYVNTEYSGEYVTKPQKLVITSGGSIEEWSHADEDQYSSGVGEYKVAEGWVDSSGKMYSTVDVEFSTGAIIQMLWRLNKSGNTIEANFKYGNAGEYPEKIDPEAEAYGPLFYWIGYRR